jgi:DNA-binding MarR family transcriptional regulator
MNENPNTPLPLEQIVAQITRLMADMEARAFQQDGFAELSMRQVYYMETIARLEHPSFGEVAEALGVTRPSVTALVGKLIRSGYVQKVQDHEDRRSFHIVLTEKGQQFTQLHQNLHRMVVQALTARLNEAEIEQLTALLQKAVGV